MDPGLTPDRNEQSDASRALVQFAADVAALCELVDVGVEVDGQATLVEGERWIIYGRTTYDGEIVLGEYDDEDEAAAVLRAMPRRGRGSS